MNDTGQGILERVEAHLRAAKRIALDGDDTTAFHAIEAAIRTIQDALKAVKHEQEQGRREHTAEVRRLAQINKGKPKLELGSPTRYWGGKAA
jgi:hypothetical protein